MIKPPAFTTEEKLPDEVRRACLTIVAHMINSGSEVVMITLRDLMHEELPLGSFEISARRVDESTI